MGIGWISVYMGELLQGGVKQIPVFGGGLPQVGVGSVPVLRGGLPQVGAGKSAEHVHRMNAQTDRPAMAPRNFLDCDATR